MAKSGTAAQLRATAFLRRGAWELRRAKCSTLLLLIGLAVLSLGFWVYPPSQIQWSSFGVRFQASGDTHALRWGAGNDVVMLKGQSLQRILPSRYPNGANNTFQCDLPSLRFQCDLDRDKGCKAYPQLFPSAALFDNWKAENTAMPPAIFDSICHFNVSDPYEFRLAQMFREMEVPFVAYGIPELTAAAVRWTDEYLTEKLNPKALYKVHVANDSHFMYYLKSKQLAGEKDTYESRWMTYPQFVKTISDVKPLEEAGKPHEYYYFMLKQNDFSKQASFIYNELQFLNPTLTEHDPRFGDLFIRDAAIAKERGMRCRLGMRGIIADGHIDGGLNHISMIRGTKRYVIAPPSACQCLGLMIQGQSARHTAFNWSDTSALSEDARNCPAAEVALTAGEVLYLPSYWYHHIVSLDTSIQCNIRSGFSIRDDIKQFLTGCGFGPK
ncbi:hypothetical protein L915_07880 [Phytophthora nicotianae]|uniref:Cupin-like domain-containing protein n=3 Tax=Phytophthora nicotianae TaxID=4792 RepID=W2Q909_PHYN3|nr:hypothetical protein PPTG_11266 [Phytophthora nicotianae INRA-310]ETI47771.1 hypothetical protein F443_08056 [Phytophthora nicotianae P1569]ETK87746.1 hypothetical protein L915_07880 [Phytophthora nicotianae]KUF73990.1 Hypoxia-inducible factor 1-alpha inhibitor [Phytophthora nicotianae]ETM47560.1 hypothetical protein L914_07767 [Phytophthora nicotianae]ETN09647.1 hypothetical protein PPTG_11266 [Phytophthora nicotianae INRA-310]